jgi:hypothetical protein
VQRIYEVIRPVVLFGMSPAERAAQTGAAERTVYRQVQRFTEGGMANLVPTASDGMIEQEWRTDLELVTPQHAKLCRCGQPMIYQGFTSRTISKEAMKLPANWPQPDEREQPMRVLVLSAAKVWQCSCGVQVEQPVERG